MLTKNMISRTVTLLITLFALLACGQRPTTGTDEAPRPQVRIEVSELEIDQDIYRRLLEEDLRLFDLMQHGKISEAAAFLQQLPLALRDSYDPEDENRFLNEIRHPSEIRTVDLRPAYLSLIMHYPECYNCWLAYGYFYFDLGTIARGTRFRKDTPDEAFAQMRANFLDAQYAAEQVLELAPNHYLAYSLLSLIRQFDRDSDIPRDQIELALAEQPTSSYLWNRRLQQLTPRWSGSYERMQQAMDRVQPYVNDNPQLTFTNSAILQDQLSMALINNNQQEFDRILEEMQLKDIQPYSSTMRAFHFSRGQLLAACQLAETSAQANIYDRSSIYDYLWCFKAGAYQQQ